MSKKKSKKKEVPAEKRCDFCAKEATFHAILKTGGIVKLCHNCVGLYFVHHFRQVKKVIRLRDNTEITGNSLHKKTL